MGRRFRETLSPFCDNSAAVLRTARRYATAWRHVFLTLAALAIVVKVLIPPGFMAAARSDEAPFPIVLCTSEGTVTLSQGQAPGNHDDSHQGPAKNGHDAPCAFAGLASLAPPPSGEVTFLALAPYQADTPKTPKGLAPGRGLTGPPLPARGPPSLLI